MLASGRANYARRLRAEIGVAAEVEDNSLVDLETLGAQLSHYLRRLAGIDDAKAKPQFVELGNRDIGVAGRTLAVVEQIIISSRSSISRERLSPLPCRHKE
jgi:hypothetical protein